MTGPSCLASSAARAGEMASAAIRMTAAGTAATASGQPRGLATAQASTASSAISETVSAAAAFSASPSPPGRMVLVPTAHPTREGMRLGLLGTDLVDDVERGLGGAPEPGEAGVGDDLSDGGL